MRLLDVNRLAVMSAVGLIACTTTTASTRTQAPDAAAAEPAVDDEAEAGLRDYHRYQHRGGVAQFIAMGLDTVGPSEAERPRVEEVQRELYACMEPAAAVQQRLHLTIADGVAAGAVDLAKVDALIGQLDASAHGVRECSVAALDQLHAILSPLERAELIEKVQAHLEVWRQVNSVEGQIGRGTSDRLGALARLVALTPDQVERATAALHTALSGQPDRYDRSKVDADVRDLGAAFEGDSFDARSTVRYEDAHTASHGAARMAIFYETVTPMLNPAQRAQLAERLRARAMIHPVVSAN